MWPKCHNPANLFGGIEIRDVVSGNNRVSNSWFVFWTVRY
jgi:hypothetical protein